jgi:hypothetical protein
MSLGARDNDAREPCVSAFVAGGLHTNDDSTHGGVVDMNASLRTIATLLVAAAAANAQGSAPQVSADSPTLVVPGGTTILTQLERPLSTRTAHVGDTVYLQTSHPLLVNDTVIIPAGTYLEATVAAATAHGLATRELEVRMRLARLVFANGYVLTTADSVVGRSASDADVRDDGLGTGASIATAAIPVAGIVIGAVSNGLFGAFIGGGLGSAISPIVALAGGSNARMDAGSPLYITLENSLAIDVRRATASAPARSAQFIVRRPAPQQELTCYNPGTPGTPDVIIPGAPGTPGMGDIPPTPPSPPTVIPGVPGTPGYWYRCR